jgi:hypothetical protein
MWTENRKPRECLGYVGRYYILIHVAYISGKGKNIHLQHCVQSPIRAPLVSYSWILVALSPGTKYFREGQKYLSTTLCPISRQGPTILLFLDIGGSFSGNKTAGM